MPTSASQLEPLSDPRRFLELFAARFVIAGIRDRFVHEALKKPMRLQERICHSISDLFPQRFRGGHPPFSGTDACVQVFRNTPPLAVVPWSKLEPEAGSTWECLSSRNKRTASMPKANTRTARPRRPVPGLSETRNHPGPSGPPWANSSLPKVARWWPKARAAGRWGFRCRRSGGGAPCRAIKGTSLHWQSADAERTCRLAWHFETGMLCS